MIRYMIALTLALTTWMHAAQEAEAKGSFSGRPGWNLRLNDDTTDQLAAQLKQDFRRCQANPKIYRYDCYRRSYRTGAQSLRGSSEYAPIAKALALVERRIGAVVEANLDPSQPKLNEALFVNHRAVKPEALPQIKQATIAAMEEATTLLLRTPDNTQQKHFQRIAAVIQSNKVLLRSALLELPRTLVRVAQLWSLPQLPLRG
ncbi:hypothetical protein [Phaeobacter sp. HF9A]|uniref:hypothetical protein n=1 Tax=Phaeobacter sp. HF9A TaxID=2721561 RepID=UPI001430E062|nr:hypothetical protein [Phaeobacter sp. HF9A]NIZ15578.1 hypothetical protein [Phaeobacter sp. HF9A]